jgi:predicted dehydrogenase/nucleoside-diphosphate-sugar epimerase
MAMHHLKAISLQENASVVALADPAIEIIRQGTELPPDLQFFSDPEELLTKIKPDVVHVCSPPSTHAGLSALALRHRANIYVEKPFALNLPDAREIISLAESAGLGICAGHQLLFEASARNAMAEIGKLGRIVHVESYFSFNPVKGTQDGRPTMPPLDQLVDILPHPVYLLLHFMKRTLRKEERDCVRMKAVVVDPRGDVYGILQAGDVTGSLLVTLEGRPIECYVKVTGTNGSLHADFVRGNVVVLAGPGTSGISKVIHPYRQSWQTVSGATKSLFKRVFSKQKSYPGLVEIIRAFYGRLLSGESMEISNAAILQTVEICEEVTKYLKRGEEEINSLAESELEKAELQLQRADTARGIVLVTGGTGFLGKAVARELRRRNWATRVAARSMPPASKKIPGVEYTAADLWKGIPDEVLKDVSVVVHCAAETSGGKDAHSRNSIDATRNILAASAKAGVRKFIHISSIAVLKTSNEAGGPVDENTPFVPDGEGRGPYVWGKLESEKVASSFGTESGVEVRVIRPGALVDYADFDAPGRLGREVGPLFVCIGGKNSRIGLCDVHKAAEVVRAYVEDFDNMPSTLNLIEPNGPTHAELLSRLLSKRPDLKVIYFPLFLLRLMSPALKLLQKILRPGNRPIDVYAVFAPEKYNCNLAMKIFGEMNR